MTKKNNMDSERISTVSLSFRYEVAFSFCKKDEELANQIDGVVKGRISTFLYSKKQEEIAGKDGEEQFHKVFGQEARLVAVLYGHEWGKTPWTRIEETAIHNRGYDHGYDFVIFIMTRTGLEPPKWLHKNRLWVGLDRYGVEGAAAVIESRVQELDGNIRELTVAEKAKQKASEIEFEHTRESFLRSQDGVESAYKEVENLFSEIKTIANQIQSPNLKFRIDEDTRNLIVFSSGYTLFLYWSVQYSNSLDHSALRLQIFRGSIPFKNQMPIDDPERLVEEDYYFDKVISGKCGWRFRRRSGEFFITDQLVERSMNALMDRIKANKDRD